MTKPMTQPEPWPFWEQLLERYGKVYNPVANAQALHKEDERKRRAERFNAQFESAKEEPR